MVVMSIMVMMMMMMTRMGGGLRHGDGTRDNYPLFRVYLLFWLGYATHQVDDDPNKEAIGSIF